MTKTLIDVSQAKKRFGKLHALDGLDLEVRQGEVVGLIGPNGSGKTTLVNVMSGAFRADSGSVRLNGVEANRWSPQRRCRWGLARTRQVARPLGKMTVFENVLVGALFGRQSRQSMKEARFNAERVLHELGLEDVRTALPTDIPVQRLKLLEMARALACDPQVILLDETLAGLTHGESEQVLDVIREKRRAGLGILFIEHRLAEVLELSDRVYVMHAGRLLAEGLPEEVADDPQVLKAYLGVGDN